MLWTKERLQEFASEKLRGRKLIVVSHREPYMHRYVGDEIQCIVPASGMASAIDPLMRTCGGIWVAHGGGNADRETVDSRDRLQVPPDNPSYTLRRVWLTREQEAGYYYGCANEALWPLCHIAYTRPLFNDADWEMYKLVNQRFADVVLEEVGNEPAVVFIQDYHFALLPRMIKNANPNVITSQFWHIPWPNAEAFRICPWREEILDGLLGNDLLGFHIQHDRDNFMRAVEQGIESKVGYQDFSVVRGGKTTLIGSFPISVDFEQIAETAESAAVIEEMNRIKRLWRLTTPYIGLGVDRLDYTKGIPDRLLAIDRLLERYPQYQQQLTFLQIGVPSRVHIKQYQALNEEVESLVERINWKYQSGGWKPIVILKDNFPRLTVLAAYRLADFCLVSPLHDGMNLVAKEFVASRADETGVLILSPFTGSARELGPEAMLINPYSADRMAEAIHQALTMPMEEQQRRMRRLRETVQTNNVFQWAAQFLSTLFQVELRNEEPTVDRYA